MKIDNTIVFFLALAIIFFNSCSKENNLQENPNPVATGMDANLGFVRTDKGAYELGENVVISSFEIENSLKERIGISQISMVVRSFDGNKIIHESNILNNEVDIKAGSYYKVPQKKLLSLSSTIEATSYGVYVRLKFTDNTTKEYYTTFFRVMDAETLVTYKIEREEYQGLPIFRLRGGLSAEYTVQKAAASFISGISHSWTSPIETVASTPDFLERSINYTVDFYNDAIGPSTPVEVVIISTGVPGVQYLAQTMNALVLPLHYLVASGTVKEVQTMLKHANQSGYSTYGTIGHDFSITDKQSVGWIKLLDIPEQYKKFLSDHQVKNVILLGHSGNSDGETAAQKVADSRAKYEAGSLYLMRFSGEASDGYLKQILTDYNTTRLKASTNVADWEAGIISEQLENFSNTLKVETSIFVTSVTANDGVHLWNLGTYASLSFLKKNSAELRMDGSILKGISLNPYLKGHPGYESWAGYVPFLYFGAFSDQFQYDNWLKTEIKSVVQYYFPDIVFEDLTFWVNHRESMAMLLEFKGLTVRRNNYSIPEVWNIGDGINSLSEIRAQDIVTNTTAVAYKEFQRRLIPLDLNDLHDIASEFNKIEVLNR